MNVLSRIASVVMDSRGGAQESSRVRRALAYGWLSTVMRVTAPLPDFRVVMRLRGALARPCFKR